MTADIVIPVYRPDEKFTRLLLKLQEQSVPPGKIIIVNTGEEYWQDWAKTTEGLSLPETEVHHISQTEFDHGRTRNLGVSYSDAETVILMTDDAIPADEHLIGNLLKPFSDPEVGAVYARQLAGPDAGIAERFSRDFNYPDRSEKKTLADLERLGIKTFFCSNVCAAYRKAYFDKLGGFVDRAIFNEDMVYAANLIDHGYAVVYAADAQVIHSHSYTNRQQMQRNFDLAVSQAMHPEVFDRVSSESEGFKFVKSAFAYFVKNGRPFAIFPFVITSAYKYFGYRAGRRYRELSKEKILGYTMNRTFFMNLWENDRIGEKDV
ncbi:MAG: glycosyltransferase [Lachnospiraceae bacterium]|nr:glycosyltransferase [Lachnospiraceae bacterium]